MPRASRIVLPGYLHHVFQRGHNRQAVFKTAEDFQKFLNDLKELKELFGVRVYAWCLTANQVNLLVEPPEECQSLSDCLKGVFARTTRYRNRIEGRSGTIWEGRYRSSPVHPDWILPCIRYIERLPIHQKLVDGPEDYHWSSYRAHVGEEPNSWMDRLPDCLDLGSTPVARRDRYWEYIHREPDPQERNFIRDVLHSNQLTGPPHFVDQVEELTGIRVPWRKRGRPRKGKSASGRA